MKFGDYDRSIEINDIIFYHLLHRFTIVQFGLLTCIDNRYHLFVVIGYSSQIHILCILNNLAQFTNK